MSKTTQEHIDELKESIVSATKNTISGFLSEATEQYKASLTEADDSEDDSKDDDSEDDDSKDDESIEESDDSEDDEKSKDDESIEESDDSEDDEKSKDDESEDDKELSEGLKVTAVRHATPNKTEDIKINNIRELNKLAATGQYGWFGVEKRNGDYEEYTVDEKNKLVLM